MKTLIEGFEYKIEGGRLRNGRDLDQRMCQDAKPKGVDEEN